MKYYSNKKVENYHPNKVALQTMDWLTAENAVQLGTSNLQHPSNTSQSFDMLAGHSVEIAKNSQDVSFFVQRFLCETTILIEIPTS